MTRKYEFTGETKTHLDVTLHQIVAVAAFGTVDIGDVGGWIETEENLSQRGKARVSDNAQVFDNAWVYGDARVSGNAQVSGDAKVFDNAWVSGNARVSGDAQVSGNAWVFGDAWVSGNARVECSTDIAWFSGVGTENGTLTVCKAKAGLLVSRGCFSGSLEEFEAAVNNRHGDNDVGNQYNLLIQFIKARFA